MTTEPITTIYNYTEGLVEAQETSINRLDQKLSTFIGFSGLLIKFALTPEIEEWFRLIICIFAVISILAGGIGLGVRRRTKDGDPSELMTEEWIKPEREEEIKALIINSRIKITRHHEKVLKRKGLCCNLTFLFFIMAAAIFGYSVIDSGKLSIAFQVIRNLF